MPEDKLRPFFDARYEMVRQSKHRVGDETEFVGRGQSAPTRSRRAFTPTTSEDSEPETLSDRKEQALSYQQTLDALKNLESFGNGAHTLDHLDPLLEASKGSKQDMTGQADGRTPRKPYRSGAKARVPRIGDEQEFWSLEVSEDESEARSIDSIAKVRDLAAPQNSEAQSTSISRPSHGSRFPWSFNFGPHWHCCEQCKSRSACVDNMDEKTQVQSGPSSENKDISSSDPCTPSKDEGAQSENATNEHDKEAGTTNCSCGHSQNSKGSTNGSKERDLESGVPAATRNNGTSEACCFGFMLGVVITIVLTLAFVGLCSLFGDPRTSHIQRYMNDTSLFALPTLKPSDLG